MFPARSRITFVKIGKPKYEKWCQEFIEEYEPYIIYKVKQNINKKQYHEDMKQSIILSLIKMFPKRFKYTDWDWVVRESIRRKVIDFNNRMYNLNKKLIFEHSFSLKDEYDNTLDYTEIGFSKIKDNSSDRKQNNVEIVDLLRNVDKRINDENDLGGIFSDWDREFFEVLFELYDDGNATDTIDLMECMGFSKNERAKYMMRLRKLRENLIECFGESHFKQLF